MTHMTMTHAEFRTMAGQYDQVHDTWEALRDVIESTQDGAAIHYLKQNMDGAMAALHNSVVVTLHRCPPEEQPAPPPADPVDTTEPNRRRQPLSQLLAK